MEQGINTEDRVKAKFLFSYISRKFIFAFRENNFCRVSDPF
jgi:hypothetical protein